MSYQEAVSGLSLSRVSNEPSCQACTQEKLTIQDIPECTPSKSLGILDIVHSDVCCSIEVISKSEAKYFVTTIAKASRWTAIYSVKNK